MAVTGGRLRVAEPGTVRDLPVVDIEGLVVSPNFIDVHSHADIEPLLHDDLIHASRIAQGVTTEVAGNCGFSTFPVPEGRADDVRQFFAMMFGPGAETSTDLDAYAARLHGSGLASNVAPLVGHGTLRAATLGYDNRATTADELALMRCALGEAMRAGAFGVSTGLCYTPANYAPSDEVEALAEVVAEAGGIYATHIRNETDVTPQSLGEAIAVAQAASCPLHVSHLKVAGRRNWDSSGEVLALLDEARERGVDVTADVYPYTAASTALHSLLRRGRRSTASKRSGVTSPTRRGVGGWPTTSNAVCRSGRI